MLASIIAFYKYVLSSEGGLHEGYANLIDRKVFTGKLPRSFNTWKRLGSLRNRVDHPVDSKTKTHSAKITVKEIEDIFKELQVALQEMFDNWTSTALP